MVLRLLKEREWDRFISYIANNKTAWPVKSNAMANLGFGFLEKVIKHNPEVPNRDENKMAYAPKLVDNVIRENQKTHKNDAGITPIMK